MKLSASKNEKEVKKIIARFMTIVLKFKMKNFKNIGWAQIKGASFRKKAMFNFIKLMNTLEKSKHSQWKAHSFYLLKLPFIHEKGIEGSMNKLNDILLNPKQKMTLNRNKRMNLSTNNLNVSDSVEIHKSHSTSKINKK